MSQGPLSGSAAHPDDSTPVYPGAPPLAPERAARLAADPERQRLIKQMLSAATKGEIASAHRAQTAWLIDHPGDFGVLAAGEALSYAEEAVGGSEPPARPAVPVAGPTNQ